MPQTRFLVRSLHKWLGLIVGIQVLIWLGSGLYMVIVDLDFIHGDPLVTRIQQPLDLQTPLNADFNELLGRYPDANGIDLVMVMGDPHFVVTTPAGVQLVDAAGGAVVSPLEADEAQDIAEYHYAGPGVVKLVSLITSNPPGEIGRRALPLWRVDFQDRYDTSFYINPDSGALVTRRHRYWRIFDFMFMLHIMDYEERSDAHNALLKWAQFVGVAFGVSGLWLLFYSFNRQARKRTGAR